VNDSYTDLFIFQECK